MRAAKLGNKYAAGIPKSPEHRKKISAARLGHSVSQETREKIAAKLLGYKHTPEARENMGNGHRGFRHSDETKKRFSLQRRGEKGSNWHGGIWVDQKGYVRIYCPSHPFARDGYVFEHRLVMEAHLGRTLLETEVVHHINGIVDDNRIENLMLFSTSGEHTSYHKRQLRGDNAHVL